jgi:hypothetical protein
MDVAVASKYGNDLTNFTRTIIEEVHSTSDTFKTDLQNTLPRQIRSIVQQVHGESQGKQPDLEPSTAYPGNTAGNVVYVDANSPYMGGVSMGNLGSFPTANLPYPGGGVSTSGNPGFPTHTTPTNPNPNFQQPYYQTMSYGPNIPPTGIGVPHGPILDIFSPITPAYATPNPRVGENEGVRDQITRTLREFRVPDLAKFTGDDAKTTYEHVGQFLA